MKNKELTKYLLNASNRHEGVLNELRNEINQQLSFNRSIINMFINLERDISMLRDDFENSKELCDVKQKLETD